ncbi:CLIP-associated protein-like isoform X1 [Typha latifolia]|uniref:CLIP-associated protein-like isoform X1 n=2 Tax=Typha latifolia TaxID=4733 RepID=UPI003C2FDCED
MELLYVNQRNMLIAKSDQKKVSHLGGESKISKKPIEPMKVYSEKVLIREIDKVASMLAPDKEWSVRIKAMQRFESLVLGGATGYPSFSALLKQLVTPLMTQLLDRRSSVVKQACHLLSFLSKELSRNFEACAEIFIPVLFKLVVITVTVISEPADSCIKMMLRHCKVARILPRIADCAKNERSAVLRARCCEYALLMLEYWADAPEIQRSADLYDELIRCCVADATTEVRSIARTCYRIFVKIWPVRAHQLFSSLDPARQKIIDNEDGGRHKTDPLSVCGGIQLVEVLSHSPTPNFPGRGTTSLVATDESTSITSGTFISSGGMSLSQTKSSSRGPDMNSESLLPASKEEAFAFESSPKGVDSLSDCDSPSPLAIPATSISLCNSGSSGTTTSTIVKGVVTNDVPNMPEFPSPQLQALGDITDLPCVSTLLPDFLPTSPSAYTSKSYESSPKPTSIERTLDIRPSKKLTMQVEKQHIHKDNVHRDSQNNHIPNFQRPLLRKQMTSWFLASGRNNIDDRQLMLGEMAAHIDVPSSLSEALTEALNPRSDWITRIFAFDLLRSVLQQGPKGIQEVTQSFEKVMNLFSLHLDDPHYRVAQAALSTLVEIIPVCRKSFQSYLERTLPHIFSRLNDPKELVRQPCSTVLKIVGETYSVESLLPALLRSLDEQRHPKTKLAVVEYANSCFSKHVVNNDTYLGNSFIRLWLGKLALLFNDKNVKLKESAVAGFISIYSHFDPTSVLSFILSMSVEEQKPLRRMLKQYTPRIEVDIINFLHYKKEKQGPVHFLDKFDFVGPSFAEGYIGISKKDQSFGRYSADSVSSVGLTKVSVMQQPSPRTGQALSDQTQQNSNWKEECGSNSDATSCKTLDKGNFNTGRSWTISPGKADLISFNGHKANGLDLGSENQHDTGVLQSDGGAGIPQIIHQVCSGNNGNSKHDTLHRLFELLKYSERSVWDKYLHQILFALLEMVNDPESSIRELSLSLLIEMLDKQNKAVEDCIETVIGKVLHATKDASMEVVNQAHRCLTTVVTQYNPLRCLTGIISLMVNEDEKFLMLSIYCLTKLVGRLSKEELMTQLAAFLPAVLDAFTNQVLDIRKMAVFCLADIYLILGKEFLPYLEDLNSTQLQLVTIYAQRISQAGSINTQGSRC